LGNRIGSLICIDNNARGDFFNKFIRARVHLPINQPLQRWIPLIDRISDDGDVVVSVHYEWLPTFCFFYVLIGHKDKDCSLPITMKKNSYSPKIRVPPTHQDDPRR
jgi:hypothetical protein